MLRKLFLFLLVSFVIGGMAGARAQEKELIIKDKQDLDLSGYLYHFEDKTVSESISSVRFKKFTPVKDEILNAGYSASNHWVHFSVRNEEGKDGYFFVEVTNPRLNFVSFYEFRRDSLINQVKTGDHLPFESRIFPNKNFLYPFHLKVGEEADFYIMAEKKYEVMVFKTYLWRAQDFEKEDRSSYTLWGILAGITLFIFLVTMILGYASRDSIYFWYILFLATVFVHIATQSGLAFQFFYPDFPYVNHFDLQVTFTWMLMVTNLHFMQKFIRQTRSNSRIYIYLQAYKLFVLLAFVLNITFKILNFKTLEPLFFKLTFNMTLLFTLISVVFAFASLFERIRKREKEVLFFTFTFSVQLLGYITVFAVNLAYTKAGDPLVKIDSYYIMVGTFLIDLILLSLGLAYFRYDDYRKQNESLLIALHKNIEEQSKKTIEALEIERNRIAEDLYDDVGAMLSTAINYIASVVRIGEIREKYPVLMEARSLLNTAIENLRKVSHNLMPKNFAQLGLAKSLEETVNKLSGSGIQFSFIQAGKEKRLDASTEIQIFRIATELINDVLKHSEATEASLQISFLPDSLNMMLEDNGLGQNRHEMNNLTSKVAFVNGNIEIDKNIHGSTVIVEIPYEPA